MPKLAITPMGKPRMTQRDRWAKREVVVRYHAYCDLLNVLLPRYELPGSLHIVFGIAMPASWSKKKKAEHLNQPHRQKPDVDNLAKAFMDAFHSDDSHVWALKAEKYWSDEPYILL